MALTSVLVGQLTKESVFLIGVIMVIIKSLHKTLGKTNYEETRQLFLNNVLTEALDDGSPMYYNSNILGRYYRKDYFES